MERVMKDITVGWKTIINQNALYGVLGAVLGESLQCC